MPPSNFKNLGVLVKLALAFAILAGCKSEQDQSAWWQGEQERLELIHRLQLQQFRLEHLPVTDAAELDRLRAATGQAGGYLASMRGRRLAVSREVESLKTGRAAALASILQSHRQKMLGFRFARLSTASGKEFQDAFVVAIEDAGVTVRHADGSARLRFADLDAEHRALFGLEEHLANEAEQRELMVAAAYERWIDGEMAAQREEQSRADEITRRKELELVRQSQQNQADARANAAAYVSPMAQSAAGVGSRGYRSTCRSRPTYHYVYYRPEKVCGSMMSAPPVGHAGKGCRVPSIKSPNQSFAHTTVPSIP